MSDTPIQKSLTDNFKELSIILGNPLDLNLELHGANNYIGIAYLESLVNEGDLKTNLLQPLLQNSTERNISPDKLAALLPGTDLSKLRDLEQAASDLLEGRTIVFFEKESSTMGLLKAVILNN